MRQGATRLRDAYDLLGRKYYDALKALKIIDVECQKLTNAMHVHRAHEASIMSILADYLILIHH